MLSLSLASYSAQSLAETPLNVSSCNAHIPAAKDMEAVDLNTPYTISSDELSAKQGDHARFSGDVEFAQGDRSLNANETLIDQQKQTLTALGEIRYQDGQITVDSDSLEADMVSDQATLKSAQYQLHGQQGRGEAHNLKIDAERQLSLERASYTACPPGDKSWEVRAESIEIDTENEWATTRNATVRLFDVPVMYLPYFSYPIGNQRHSGFLFPSISTSTSNGIDIETPYYWNIAPNYDATITPRLMTRRGLQLQNEFRYLVDEHEGELNFDFMTRDRVFDGKRYMLNWSHQGSWQRHWRLDTDYSRISDDNYFNDLGDRIGKESENRLLQQGTVGYHTSNWYSRLRVQDFQVLGNTEDPHTILPQLSFVGDWDLPWQQMSAGVSAELSNFAHGDSQFHTAQRYHIEPSINLPYSVPAGYLNANMAMLMTYYNQDGGTGQQEDYQDGTFSRTMPRLSVDAGLNFERESLLIYKGYTQTLEPRVKYLYIPYRNQDEIGLYDTDYLQQDYWGLFRDQRFSGLDRIADANQLTVGVSSRFLSPNNVETLRLSIGQIFYFDPSRVTLLRDSDVSENTSSALAFEGDGHFADDWYVHLGLQIDTSERETRKANAAIEWRPELRKLIQLNYRYSVADETMISDVNQIGSKVAWPIKDNISAVGSYYYDTELNRSIENYFGVQYDACCWAIRLTYRRNLKSNFVEGSERDAFGKFDSSLRLDFEIRGLGGRDTSSQEDMLRGGTFKYGRPFYLNN